MKTIIFLCTLLSHIFTQAPYNESEYSLGSNLIINSQFSTPPISVGFNFQDHSLSVPGWSCTNTCQYVRLAGECTFFGHSCIANWTVGVDLDSGIMETVSQTVNISNNGLFLFHIEWIAPLWNPIGKSFDIYLNGSIIGTQTITTSNYTASKADYLLNLTLGLTTFSIQMSTPQDHYGILIGNITLNELIPIIPQTQTIQVMIEKTLGNIGLSSVNRVPGARIFAYGVINFLWVFDRLQLYYFHHHNLTFNSDKLLSKVNQIAEESGSWPQILLEECNSTVSFCQSINNFYNYLMNQFEHQTQYTDSQFLSRNEKGIGFFANNLEFFFYQLPGIFLIYIIFLLVFRALFNYRISKYFRKYAFYGILLVIIYQGNVEKFTFYFFSECKLLFSIDWKHKMTRIFMLLFFWLMMVSVVGGLTLFWVNYRKLVKYFLEQSKYVSLQAIFLQSLERSVYPLLFGCVHAILLEHLLWQSIVLGILELTYFCTKIATLRSNVFKCKFKVTMLAFSSLLRMVLIITLYLYQALQNPSIINLIHHDIVWMYVVCWLSEEVYDISMFISDLVEAVNTSCKTDEKQLKDKSKSKKIEVKKKEQNVQDVAKPEQIKNSILKKVRQGKSGSKKAKFKTEVLDIASNQDFKTKQQKKMETREFSIFQMENNFVIPKEDI